MVAAGGDPAHFRAVLRRVVISSPTGRVSVAGTNGTITLRLGELKYMSESVYLAKRRGVAIRFICEVSRNPRVS